jgi:CubicO group peptidase (beta-lactamase class C family)
VVAGALLATATTACSNADDGADASGQSSSPPIVTEPTTTAPVAPPTFRAPPTIAARDCTATPPADGCGVTLAPPSAPLSPPPPVTFAYPGTEWDTVDAVAAGLDPTALDQLATRAESAGSSCTAITRDGKLVESRTWGPLGADEPREAWSVTKSVTSTLIGIAQDQGLLTVADRVSKYVPEWLGTPSEEVTIRDILSNASGRHWDADTDYVQMAVGAEDKTAFAVALGQDAAPGVIWAYNNSAIQVLEAVLETATGESPVDYAARVLFDPIGMTHSRLTTDAAGNALMYAGLQTTCADLARFGYLMVHYGEWNGTQLVSGEYVARATRESSTELNAAYGWLWWLNRRGPIASTRIATRGPGDGSVADGQMLPQASADTFWALGLFDQVVAVIPAEDIVAVRMGQDPPADAPFGIPELTDGVLDAVVEHRPS